MASACEKTGVGGKKLLAMVMRLLGHTHSGAVGSQYFGR
jgi:hypothetical protein